MCQFLTKLLIIDKRVGLTYLMDFYYFFVKLVAMYIREDRFSQLYRETYDKKAAQAIWYQRPHVRTGITVVGIVTAIALMAIALTAAYALAVPSSSLGTIGHQMLGFQGVAACISMGTVLSVVLGFALVFYRKQSVFELKGWLADHIEEAKGFSFAVKKDDRILAHLSGTVHRLPLHYQGLSEALKQTIDGCSKVIMEFYNPLVKEHVRRNVLELEAAAEQMQIGLDAKILDYAMEHNKPIQSLEMVDYSNGFLKVPPAVWDHCMVAWQLGDQEHAIELVAQGDMVTCKKLYHQRNIEWMATLAGELKGIEENSSLAPLFIPVGAGHLFDIPIMGIKGLITHIRDLGYLVS